MTQAKAQAKAQHDYQVKPSDPDAPRYRPKCELPEHAAFADLLTAAEGCLADAEGYARTHGCGPSATKRIGERCDRLRAAIAKAKGG